MPGEEFEEMMQTTDSLLFTYVFDSEQDKSKQMNTQMINPIVEELKGFFKLVAFDCQDKEVKQSTRYKQICDKDEYIPFF